MKCKVFLSDTKKDSYRPKGGKFLWKNCDAASEGEFNKIPIKVLNGEQTVGHLPREYSLVEDQLPLK